ncbi:GNAT family N-acetyltransferase [Hoeflea alexandrii]|uniref:GNAT family N-acetyltransferase n=1 Tax=Hoeflea alexandrii TaxID=288436 RepID=A0ABT1CST1_9HYPH|nr:N-acetyltransferase [Hoeflea alexandrii]MCO6408620.1 GNAT family N-acetyltransferase [Hoeflea alexandrii]
MPERKCIAGKVIYRSSIAGDLPAIARLETLSDVPDGSGLSEALIALPADTLSFVAELDGHIIGHTVLTAVAGPDRALALAPLVILPAYRDMQIGTGLVRHALNQARAQGWKSVFVYGQPDYYCRFGFKSQLADGADSPLQGQRFLALELRKDALFGWSGPAAYPEPYLKRMKSKARN